MSAMRWSEKLRELTAPPQNSNVGQISLNQHVAIAAAYRLRKRTRLSRDEIGRGRHRKSIWLPVPSQSITPVGGRSDASNDRAGLCTPIDNNAEQRTSGSFSDRTSPIHWPLGLFLFCQSFFDKTALEIREFAVQQLSITFDVGLMGPSRF